MFVGHYGPTFVLKRWAPDAPMWALAIGVQLVDVAWAVFIVTGVEHVRIVPGFTASNALDLYDMPYTHSLVAALVWSVAFGAVFWRRSRRVAVAATLAVLSHWLCDLAVHRPDLPLFDGAHKVGLGLWNYRYPAFALELAFVLGGLALYVRGTRARDPIGRYGPYGAAAAFVGMQVFQVFGKPPETPTGMAIAAFSAYVAVTLVTTWIDRHREGSNR